MRKKQSTVSAIKKDRFPVLVSGRNSLESLQAAMSKEIDTQKALGYSLSNTPIIPTQLKDVDGSKYFATCLIFEK